MYKFSKAFALPVVMIAAVVMMMVLVSGLSATTSVNSGLRQQHNAKLLKQAAESGLAMASACIKANSGSITWTSANPLKPNTDCSGTESTSCPATSTSAACYVSINSNVGTRFEVTVQDDASGASTLYSRSFVVSMRSSNQSIAKQETTTLKAKAGTSARAGTVDSMSASVISPEEADFVSTGVSTNYSERAYSVCGVQLSNSQVSCTTSGGSSSPFGSTQMKNVSASVSTEYSERTYYICGVVSSNGAVSCTTSNGSSPFGASTQMKSVSAAVDTEYSERTYIVCAIGYSYNSVDCATGTNISTNPLGTTQYKGVSSSISTGYSGRDYITCGVQKADNRVSCTNSSSSLPFGSTEMGLAGYRVCALTQSYSLTCTKNDSSSPFGAGSYASVSVASNDTDVICAVYSSNKQIACVNSYSTSPFGSNQLDSISVGTGYGNMYTCAIYESNNQGVCTTSTSAQPFGTTQMKKIDTDSSGASSRVCAVYKTNKVVNCVDNTYIVEPFGTSLVVDVAAASGPYASDNYLCVVRDVGDSEGGTVYCVTNPSPGGSETPLPGLKILDISYGTKTSPYVCVMRDQPEAFCSLFDTDSPLAGTMYSRESSPASPGVIKY